MDKLSIEEFIRTNGHIFYKPEIEKELYILEKTLKRAVDGIKIPGNQRMKLIMYFKKIGENIRLD
ncbi:MAG: hypothetical protein AAF600_15760 [Bacteroidota bacterium]